MNTATKDYRVDEARDVLVSDIEQLKVAGKEALASGESKLPWVIGGAVGLLIAGIAVRAARTKPRPRFAPRRRSVAVKLVRAAALSMAGLLTRRYVQKLVDRALPEPSEALEHKEPSAASSAK